MPTKTPHHEDALPTTAEIRAALNNLRVVGATIVRNKRSVTVSFGPARGSRAPKARRPLLERLPPELAERLTKARAWARERPKPSLISRALDLAGLQRDVAGVAR